MLICSDCLPALQNLPEACADLIYLDPPFNTNTRRRAGEASYDDAFGSAQNYIAFMRPRAEQMRRTLKPNGALFFHCDWRMGHHARLMLDEIFADGVFVNEIIWHYGLGAARAKRQLMSKHDVIFWYARSPEYTFNLQRTDPSPAMLSKYRHTDEDGRRYMNSYGKKYYLQGGKPLDDVWNIPAISPTGKERAGYPTQKPLALLERIILLASNKGDTVLDPFCGSGTTLVAAQKLGRQWIGVDASPDAIRVAQQRLAQTPIAQQQL
ncbi:MAG TPA: site-specific DNA-methyltransferase [Thermoflexales bacterium]|nr:site-specific DNA-methyltransferase [Thermoflexales bacterium]